MIYLRSTNDGHWINSNSFSESDCYCRGDGNELQIFISIAHLLLEYID